MRRAIFVCAAAALAGCFGEQIREQARRTAAADHGCPEDRVVTESDATVGNDYAYWINVCGQRRYYRWQETSTVGMGSGRFLDDTQRMQASGGAR